MFRTVGTLLVAGLITLGTAFATEPAEKAGSAELQALRAGYDKQVSRAMDNYDGWLACTRQCWNTATDCEIAGAQGCKNNYTSCMDYCRAMYPGN